MRRCEKDVQFGICLRLVVSIVVLVAVRAYGGGGQPSSAGGPGGNTSMYGVTVPIMLAALDLADSLVLSDKTCTKTFVYQVHDKIVDLISYVLVAALFADDNDPVLLGLLVFRMIGVLLFVRTQNSRYLIAFADLVKVYLAYRFFFPRTLAYFPLIAAAKVAFEWYHHTIKNKNGYAAECAHVTAADKEPFGCMACG